MTDKTGGPAFPPQVIQTASGEWVTAEVYGIQQGMSLRDYFAAHAFAAFIASPNFPEEWIGNYAAIAAYAAADEMLKARNQ